MGATSRGAEEQPMFGEEEEPEEINTAKAKAFQTTFIVSPPSRAQRHQQRAHPQRSTSHGHPRISSRTVGADQSADHASSQTASRSSGASVAPRKRCNGGPTSRHSCAKSIDARLCLSLRDLQRCASFGASQASSEQPWEIVRLLTRRISVTEGSATIQR